MLIYGNVYLRDDMLSLVPRYTNLTRLMHVLIQYYVIGCCWMRAQDMLEIGNTDHGHTLTIAESRSQLAVWAVLGRHVAP